MKNQNARPKLLVHICCGPCSIFPLKQALAGEMDVWGFFYNPNIHPRAEFAKRLDSAKRLSALLSLNVIWHEDYAPSLFVKGLGREKKIFPQKGRRCAFCYESRLEKTAEAAVFNGFSAFTSSLLYSTSQDHEKIRELGIAIGRARGIGFYYEDFRKGWQQGIDESKAMGLYRQKYCGCAYSRIERYSGKKQ